MNYNSCILNSLKVIDLLQKNSLCSEKYSLGCDKPYLGPDYNPICYNTRPISLYKRDGSIFMLNTYQVFRVEKVSKNCVLLQALSGTSPNFTATGEFVSISPDCFCVIRSFPDTSITCI